MKTGDLTYPRERHQIIIELEVRRTDPCPADVDTYANDDKAQREKSKTFDVSIGHFRRGRLIHTRTGRWKIAVEAAARLCGRPEMGHLDISAFEPHVEGATAPRAVHFYRL